MCSYTVEYRVYEESKVCVCLIKPHPDDAVDEVISRFGEEGITVDVDDEPQYIMPSKLVGVAKCAPEDEFDKQKGMDIAFDRAYFKYRKNKKRLMLEIIKRVFKRAKPIVEYLNTSRKYKDIPCKVKVM